MCPILLAFFKVLAIPRYQEVATVIRGQCEVRRRSPARSAQHDPVQKVGLHDLGNGRLERQERQAWNEVQPLLADLPFEGPPANSSSTAAFVANS